MQEEGESVRWRRGDPFTVNFIPRLFLYFLQAGALPLTYADKFSTELLTFVYVTHHKRLCTTMVCSAPRILHTLAMNWVFSNARVFISATFDEYTMRQRGQSRNLDQKGDFSLPAHSIRMGCYQDYALTPAMIKSATQLSQGWLFLFQSIARFANAVTYHCWL